MSGPLTVVTQGSSIATTNAQQLITDTTIPFTKLDTRNLYSFQTISVLFNSEPSQPPSSSPYTSQTLLYSFAHGYNYIPSVWLMWQNDSPEFPADPSSVSGSSTTFYPFGDDTISNVLASGDGGSGTLAYVRYNDAGTVYTTTYADLCVEVDDINVYIYILKTAFTLIGGSVIPLYLAGVTLNIRCYVFTEPVNTSTY